jgi:hypothetical protein
MLQRKPIIGRFRREERERPRPLLCHLHASALNIGRQIDLASIPASPDFYELFRGLFLLKQWGFVSHEPRPSRPIARPGSPRADVLQDVKLDVDRQC